MISPYGQSGNGLEDLEAYKAGQAGAKLPTFPEAKAAWSLVDLAFLGLSLLKLK